MQMSGNTILITGGGTGIGRGLAEQFHRRGNRVIIAGRRLEPLEETVSANPGMRFAQFDQTDPEAIREFATRMVAEYPSLDVVIHNAGIMTAEDVLDPASIQTAEQTITTNLLGPIRLNTALLPHLVSRPRAAVLTVTSGIAFMPNADHPSYGATKAGLHSYTEALRYQLQDTNVQVIEIVPPYVQTELTGPRQATDPNAMPLDDFVTEAMDILESDPDVTQVLVERVEPLRFAEARNEYDEFFKRYNDAIRARRNAA